MCDCANEQLSGAVDAQRWTQLRFAAATAGRGCNREHGCTPDQPSVVGVRFYNQAIVLDVGAGNPFGAVMSDAREGVVGSP